MFQTLTLKEEENVGFVGNQRGNIIVMGLLVTLILLLLKMFYYLMD